MPLTCNLKKTLFILAGTILLCCIQTSCYKETTIEVTSDFSYEVRNEDYEVPATIIINNKTTGANIYSWTFDGGTPRTSNKKNPGEIRYSEAGKYTIRLEAWNDFHHSTKELEIELDSVINLSFSPEILINPYVPAEVKIRNYSTGADEYEWTFEGGEPSVCREKTPPVIRYNQPGEYEIRLQAKSGHKTYTSSGKIQLLPGLETDFNIITSIESEEMEAPWKGYLQNKSVGSTGQKWYATGGKILNDTAFHTGLSFDFPGNYTVTLEADNQKQKIQKSQDINIKPNSNLYRFENVKMGINTASCGSFFSSKLRKVFSQENLNEEQAPYIDFVFFGLNSEFSYCMFLSPDEVQNTVFETIPGAIHTRFVPFPEKTEISFTVTDFDKTNDDSRFRELIIDSKEPEGSYFTGNEVLPKLVLFETGDGRKGIIKIKQFIKAGSESYIIIDIKVQKNSVR